MSGLKILEASPVFKFLGTDDISFAHCIRAGEYGWWRGEDCGNFGALTKLS